MAISVISTDPADVATGVSPDQVIQINFNLDVDSKTVLLTTIVVYREDISEPIDGRFTVSGGTVKFMPDRQLMENAAYTVVVVGVSQGLDDYVKATDGSALATTYTFSFRTSVDTYVSLDEVTKRTDIESVGPIRKGSEEELGVAAGEANLSILNVTPAGFTSGLGGVSTITVKFSEALNVSSFLESWLTVSGTQVLEEPDYLAVPNDGGDLVLSVQDSTLDYSFPDGTVTLNGDTLTWTMEANKAFPRNAEVLVTISADVAGTSGSVLGTETKILFTTPFFPSFMGARHLRIEVGPMARDVYDDTLNRIIFKNSLWSWELTLRQFSLLDPMEAAREFVRAQSIVDLIDLLTVNESMLSGQERQLGDFRVAFRSPNLVKGSKLNVERDRAREWATKLRRLRGPMIRTAIKGTYNADERQDFRMRTWDQLLQGSIGANMIGERGTKRAQSGGLPGPGLLTPSSVLSAYYGRITGFSGEQSTLYSYV